MLNRIFTILLALASVGIVVWRWWVSEPDQGPHPWYIIAGVMMIWPLWMSFLFWRKHYLPYISGKAEKTDDGRVVKKSWMWYREVVFWGFMTPFSLTCWAFAKSLPNEAGWALLLFGFFFLLIRKTVEDEVREEDIGGIIRTALAIVLMGWVSSLKFAWNPLTWLGRFAKTLGDVVRPEFYLYTALFFATLVVTHVLKQWLFHRCWSDGKYVYFLSLFGKVSREQIFARGLQLTPKDALEHLLNSGTIHIRLQGGRRIYHPVVFGAGWSSGASDFEKLFDHETSAERLLAEARRGDEDGDDEDVAEMLRPHDVDHPGEDEGDHPEEHGAPEPHAGDEEVAHG